MSQIPFHARKRLQKEMHLLKQMSVLIRQVAQEEESLRSLTVHRVQLSKDKGMAQVYCYMPEGESVFQAALPRLVLYKPSLRKALSQLIPRRRVPDLLFKFDSLFEKQKKVDELMAKVSEDLRSTHSD